MTRTDRSLLQIATYIIGALAGLIIVYLVVAMALYTVAPAWIVGVPNG